MNNQISRVLNLLHMSHYVVAMVTKKTQILFFTLIFQWLNCSCTLSVAGVIFKVVLNERKYHKNRINLNIKIHRSSVLEQTYWTWRLHRFLRFVFLANGVFTLSGIRTGVAFGPPPPITQTTSGVFHIQMKHVGGMAGKKVLHLISNCFTEQPTMTTGPFRFCSQGY